MTVRSRYRIFLFFFSSRRRHTRYIGDWSSDVCSSDLKPCALRDGSATRATKSESLWLPFPIITYATGCSRSEERREGKSVDVGGGRRIREKEREGPNGGSHGGRKYSTR